MADNEVKEERKEEREKGKRKRETRGRVGRMSG
jgi:hypothetical protein